MDSINFEPGSIQPTKHISRRGDDSAVRRIEPKPIGRSPDRVEFSAEARAAASGQTLDIREDLVQRIRGEIDSGTYESPVKMALAIENMTRALKGVG